MQVRVGTSNTKAWELLQRAGGLSKDLEPLLASGDTAAAARHLAQADSLLAQAEQLDPNWTAAPIERGWLAYHQTDLISNFDKPYYSTWTARGLEQANRALQLKPNDPDGLELKGTLEYLRWLLNLEPDPSAASKLVSARGGRPSRGRHGQADRGLGLDGAESSPDRAGPDGGGQARGAPLVRGRSLPLLGEADALSAVYHVVRQRGPDRGGPLVRGGVPAVPGLLPLHRVPAEHDGHEGAEARYREGVEAPG